jgi:hypothetical protein
MFDIYPEDIEYLTKAYFGGQERPIEESVNMMNVLRQGTPLDLTQIPIGSIFYGANYDKADQAAVRQRKSENAHPWEGRSAPVKSPLFK